MSALQRRLGLPPSLFRPPLPPTLNLARMPLLYE